MPSSLIFAALAAAWLVVLVPMVAKRRQEVVRTAESALASRVLHRPGPPRAAHEHSQQVRMIDERIAQRESTLDEHRYRSGRGGYDPEVAAQLARQKYAFRQRVVLGLAVAAVASLVLAYTVSSLLWWVQVTLDLALAGYLGYLRRQVRIEDEVRRRRAARAAGSRAAGPAPDVGHDVPADADRGGEAVQERSSERPAAAPSVHHHPGVAVDLDDEDPTFDELQPAFKPPYRRAAGE
ncbi:MAG: gephyrin-like molybdotransferase receptor GlpR [Pseudonocardiaceae bacterium]